MKILMIYRPAKLMPSQQATQISNFKSIDLTAGIQVMHIKRISLWSLNIHERKKNIKK